MDRGRAAMIVVALTLVVLPTTSGLITRIPTPKELYECYMYKSANVSMSETPAKIIQEYCISKYTLQHMDDPITYKHNITKEGVRYLESLFRQLDGEIHEMKKSQSQPRSKRQVFQTWRVRQEIRTLSRPQFQRLIGCFNRLKNDYVCTQLAITNLEAYVCLVLKSLSLYNARVVIVRYMNNSYFYKEYRERIIFLIISQNAQYCEKRLLL
jgi:hypothetical protein